VHHKGRNKEKQKVKGNTEHIKKQTNKGIMKGR
jgi:hypothetical protein